MHKTGKRIQTSSDHDKIPFIGKQKIAFIESLKQTENSIIGSKFEQLEYLKVQINNE